MGVKMDPSHHIWRQPRLIRSVTLFFIGFMSLFATAILIGLIATGDTRAAIVALAIVVFALLPTCIGLWLMIIRPFIALNELGVLIQNPFCQMQLGWEEIAECWPGYFGVSFRTRQGRTVTAIAVQKENWATWLGKRTASDELCELIRHRGQWPLLPSSSESG